MRKCRDLNNYILNYRMQKSKVCFVNPVDNRSEVTSNWGEWRPQNISLHFTVMPARN